MNEFERRQASIRRFMADQEIEALLINGVANFAWATCGAASYVNTATSTGEAWLLITADAQYLFANNIEATRLDGEEELKAQGWEFVVNPWYEATDALVKVTSGLKIGADVPYPNATDISGALAEYRTHLSPEEQERFRLLGQRCGKAMNAAIGAVKPGMSEYEIAALLAYEAQRRQAQAVVNLIAVDENIYNYRHPLPTGKVMERYAMLVLCGRWQGLVASITRLVYFGALPADLRRKAEAVAEIDAVFIANTRPALSLGAVFERAQAAYTSTGFAGEWTLHHQGGPASFEPRDYVATPSAAQTIAAGQAYAWNPSITGVKSEDTILVGQSGSEILTNIEGWPTLSIDIEGQIIQRPAILEIE